MRRRVFQLLTQCSHLRLLVGASSCFSTPHSMLTSSTIRRCVVVFFSCSLNAHIFDSQEVRRRVFQLLTQVFQLLTQCSHIRLSGGASSCFPAAHSMLTSLTLSLCVLVFFICSLNAHIFDSQFVRPRVFHLLTQCSHLRLLACASSCFSTAYSMLTSSTLSGCVVVFFNCSLNAHIFDS